MSSMDTELLDGLFGGDDDTDQLTDSDTVYLQFRQSVDPGLMNANFDLAPGKSSAYRSNQTGERFVDQPLRSHILNGAAFGARLNAALRTLNSPAALTDSQLLEVLALFTCHDLHKTEEAQRRRASGDTDRYDNDKDIPDDELKYYVSQLHLNDLHADNTPAGKPATNLEFQDYLASALGTEIQSGRHRQVSSMAFTQYSDWIRLMDAAAALSDPSNISRLSERLSEIDEDVTLDYHHLSDIKGVTTNLLNAAVADYLDETTAAEPIVYFHDGVLYLTPEEYNLHDKLTAAGGNALMGALADHYLDFLHDKVDEFTGGGQVQNAVTPLFSNGYIKLGRSTHLLYGLNRSEQAARDLLTDKAQYTDWTVFSQYKNGSLAALESGLIDELPDDHHTVQALATYLGTLDEELFRPLNNGDSVHPAFNLADALELDDAKTYLESTITDGSWERFSPSLSDPEVKTAADTLGITENAAKGRVEDGFKLITTRTYTVVLAHAFVQSTRNNGDERSQLPVETVMRDARDAVWQSLFKWNDDWDEARDSSWDTSLSGNEKLDEFKKELMGSFMPSTRDYIANFVSVNGESLAERQTSKSKIEECNKNTQPHICFLCNDLLVGGANLSKDFKASKDAIGVSLGFSHMNSVSASGNEPTPVVCAQCDLETTLRNSIHDIDADGSHNYLFIAPDYYYSPADMVVQQRIRTQFKADGGKALFDIAEEIITGNPRFRSDSIEKLLSAFKIDDNYQEYNEFIHNYDAAISDVTALGVYRLEPPNDLKSDHDSNSARVARWLIDAMFSVVVSWATGSRVLLTSSPLPATDFDDFPEMVKMENLPGMVKDFIGETVSISSLNSLNGDDTPSEYHFRNLTTPSAQDDHVQSPASDNDVADARLVQLIASTDSTHQHQQTNASTDTLTLNTELSVTLYKLSALLYITRRAHNNDLRRLPSVIHKCNDGFAGASLMLKGNDTVHDYNALTGASILDTLTAYTPSDTIEQLAEAGFELLRPQFNSDSNYEYELLFRTVAETTYKNGKRLDISDLKTLLVEELLGAISDRTPNSKNQNQRQAAEDFASVFVDEIFIGLCEGDIHTLRNTENSLAAGYNAALRRHDAAWLTQHTTTQTDSGINADD